jgi:hypothetical protein
MWLINQIEENQNTSDIFTAENNWEIEKIVPKSTTRDWILQPEIEKLFQNQQHKNKESENIYLLRVNNDEVWPERGTMQVESSPVVLDDGGSSLRVRRRWVEFVGGVRRRWW